MIELSEEQLPSIPLSHTLEIGEMMRKFKEISAPLIHLKQHKGVPFSASFEKVEVTCKRYNLTELFKHFQFHIYKLLNLAVTLEHCVPVKSLLWVTVSNMDTYCHVHLANALRIFGYQFLNLNYDFAKRKNELPPGFRKLNSLIQNYHIWNKYEYVVFSDTSDVILTKCPSEVLTKIISWMERKQVDLLFNAAPYVWPSNDFEYVYGNNRETLTPFPSFSRHQTFQKWSLFEHWTNLTQQLPVCDSKFQITDSGSEWCGFANSQTLFRSLLTRFF